MSTVKLEHAIVMAWTVGNVGISITSNVAARKVRIGRDTVTVHDLHSVSYRVHMWYSTVTRSARVRTTNLWKEKDFCFLSNP